MLGRFHERLQFPKLRDKAYRYWQDWDQSDCGPVNQVLIEPKANGRSLIQELQRRGVPVMPWSVERGGRRNVEMSKVARAHAASPVLYAGCVYYPAGRRWAQEVIQECDQFPAGAHDDLTDTVTTALSWLRRATPVTFKGDPDDAWDREEPDIDRALEQRRNYTRNGDGNGHGQPLEAGAAAAPARRRNGTGNGANGNGNGAGYRHD